MKLFIYNKHLSFGVELSLKNEMLAKQELLNRERPEDEKTQWLESESFPPVGKFFEVGVGLRDKTEKEKVESGEISLATIQSKIEDNINKLCYEKIISGFESTALGEVHIYDSEDVDQTNLIGAVASGDPTKFKCTRKIDSARSFYLHTNEQIKKVLVDGKARKEFLLQNCTLLKEKVRAILNMVETPNKTIMTKGMKYDAVISFDILKGWE